MNAPQPAGHRCHLSHLGLSRQEVLVIESLFRLHHDLQRQYTFGPSTAQMPADILFVDGDDTGALATWHTLRARQPSTVAIIVASQPPADPDAIALLRPLTFRKLDEIRYALRCATPRDRLLPEGRHLRVLVVDDSAVAREMMEARLAEAANSVTLPLQLDVAQSGEEALDKASGIPYDLVFLDVEMPGVDGYETCRRLKQLRPTRVAMLTSRHAAADYDRGHDAGCDHYLAKPAPAAMVNTVLRLTALKKAIPA